jgi:hypothetical protein
VLALSDSKRAVELASEAVTLLRSYERAMDQQEADAAPLLRAVSLLLESIELDNRLGDCYFHLGAACALVEADEQALEFLGTRAPIGTLVREWVTT